MHDQILQRYQERLPLLEELRDKLEEATLEALEGTKHIDRISFRVKSLQSFVEKALGSDDVPYAAPLEEIEDQVAGRIIVFYLHDLHEIRNRLSGTFNAVERKHKKPARDAEFGYESHHLICNIPSHMRPNGWSDLGEMPETFELQIRTIFMHAYAEPQHEYGYKEANDLPSQIRKELAWIAASAWGADQSYERVREWEAHKQTLDPSGKDENS